MNWTLKFYVGRKEALDEREQQLEAELEKKGDELKELAGQLQEKNPVDGNLVDGRKVICLD